MTGPNSNLKPFYTGTTKKGTGVVILRVPEGTPKDLIATALEAQRRLAAFNSTKPNTFMRNKNKKKQQVNQQKLSI